MNATRRGCLLLTVGMLAVSAGHARQDNPPPKRPEPLDLVRAMTRAGSTDPAEKAEGLLALAKCAPIIPDRDVQSLIYDSFRDPNPVVRAAACRAAGELNSHAPGYGHTRFDLALQDRHKSVRQAALAGISRRGSFCLEAEVRSLAELLDDPDPGIRYSVYLVLNRAGAYRDHQVFGPALCHVVPGLLRKVESESLDPVPGVGQSGLRAMAVWALGECGHLSPKSVPALIAAYHRHPADTKSELDIRRDAIHAVGRIGPVDGRALPFLFGILRDAKKPVSERTAACVAIAARGGPAAAPAVPDMVALLKGDAATTDPWPTLGTTQPEYVTGALVKLGEVAEPAFDTLIELAQGDRREQTTKAAIHALGELGPLVQEKALPVLTRLCFGKEGHPLESDLTRAITRFGPAAVPYLREALRGGNSEHQRLVARVVFGRFAVTGRELLPDLERITADPRHPANTEAGFAVRAIRREAGHLIP